MLPVWNEKYWLPRNITWDDLPSKFNDLIYPIYLAVPLVIIRIIWESTVGVAYLYYRTNAYASRGNLPLLSRMWEHLSGGFASESRAKKILECFWRFSYYTFAFIYGCFVMKDQIWLYDVKHCWIGYPFHDVPASVWWYYMIETGFYYSLLIGSSFDVRRSDFWQLMVHHVITVFLLSASWAISFTRVGTLILISHDVSDVFLEGGKLVRYDAHNKKMTNFMFVLFFSSWILTRLTYFPFVVIRSAITEAAGLIQPDYDLWDLSMAPYAPRLIVFALILLLFLHLFWTFIILRIAIRTTSGGQAKDVRSDSDSDYDEEEIRRREKKRLLKKKSNRASPNQSGSDDSDNEEKKDDGRARLRRVRKE